MGKSAPTIKNERDLPKLLSSEPRLFARLADQELRAGAVKKAAKLIVKGLQEFPDSVSGWLVKGNLHLKQKQGRLARTAFEKAIQIDADIPFAHRLCADLAMEEGDQEGYITHLRHLARLEVLDENIQTMLQAALLKEAAVSSGLYTRENVTRVMPGALRQALLRAGALPPEVARKTERFEFPPEMSGGGEAPQAAPNHQPALGREPLAWEKPEAAAEIRKSEGETREKYVRVSWADAVTDRSAPPLVEIGPEQFEASEEEDRGGSPTEAALNREGRGAGLPTAKLTATSTPAVDSDPPRLQVDRPTLTKPYEPPQKRGEAPKPLPTPTSSPSIEMDWEGATPLPPSTPGAMPATLPREEPEPTEKAPRFKLPPDFKLPERRPVDLDFKPGAKMETLPSAEPPRPVLNLPRLPSTPPVEEIPVAPPPPPEEPVMLADSPPALSPFVEVAAEPAPQPAPEQIPDVAPPPLESAPSPDDERSSHSAPEETPAVEAARIPRDDSPILRLMGADREKTIKPRQPISELITRFEGGVEIPPPPPRPAEPAPRVALESALESATNMADPTPTPNPEPEPVVEEEPLPKSDETLAREEEARRKLADIAREVTSKISSAPAAAKPAAPETPTAPNAAPAKPAEDGDKAKGKIATKTLAELYASQGDWNRAVEVYEALLEKFPTNEAYKKRLEALKAKQAGG